MNDAELKQCKDFLNTQSYWAATPDAFLVKWAVDFEERLGALEAAKEER